MMETFIFFDVGNGVSRSVKTIISFLLFALFLLCVGESHAQLGGSTFDLPTDSGVRLLGGARNNLGQPVSGERWGSAVSGVGDVNGDGFDDVVIASPDIDHVCCALAEGGAMVVFGRHDGSTDIDLRRLGNAGFRIIGDFPGDETGYSVSSAGDVNGDGKGDVILGAPGFDQGRGAAYVVFGKTSESPIDLRNFDSRSQGYRIHFGIGGERLGKIVSGVGDINGDGRGDVVVYADEGGAAIVYGKANSRAVDLDALGTDGFWLTSRWAITAIAGVGDVNGDGRPDLVVGQSHRNSAMGQSNSGMASVVYGPDTRRHINIDALGNDGFQIKIELENAYLGSVVAPAGDINRDGLADVLVRHQMPGTNRKIVTLVYGAAEAQDIFAENLGNRGFHIETTVHNPSFGQALSGLGDFSGNGRSIFAIGEPGGLVGNGYRAYLVDPGQRQLPIAIGQPQMPVDIFRGSISGEAGWSISPAGDFDGNGRVDLLIGAPGITVDGDEHVGIAYIVSSQLYAPANSSSYRARTRSSHGCLSMGRGTAVGARRGAGTDVSTPDSRLWLQYCSVAAGISVTAQPYVTLYRQAPLQAEFDHGISPANVSWQAVWGVAAAQTPSVLTTVRYTDDEISDLDERTIQLYQDEVLLGDSRFAPVAGQVLNASDNTITALLSTQAPLHLAIGGAALAMSQTNMQVSINAPFTVVTGDATQIDVYVRNNGMHAAVALIDIDHAGQLANSAWRCIDPLDLCASGEFEASATGLAARVHIPAGEYVHFTSVNSLASAPGQILVDASAVIEGDNPVDLYPNDNQDSHEINVLRPQSDFSVWIVAPDNVVAGGLVPVQVAVSNDGPREGAAVFNVTTHRLSDARWSCIFPADLCATVQLQGNESGSEGVMRIPPGRSLTFESGPSRSDKHGPIEIETTVQMLAGASGSADPDITNNHAVHETIVLPVPAIPEADLSVVITGADSVVTGEAAPIQVRVTNAGPEPAIALISVAQEGPLRESAWACVAPAALCAGGQFQSGALGLQGRVPIPGGGELLLESGNSRAGAAGTIAINATIAIDGDEPVDPNTGNNETHHSMSVVPVASEADISVMILAADSVTSGNAVPVHVQVGNAGPRTAMTRIRVTAEGPMIDAAWTCVAPAEICAVGEFQTGGRGMVGRVKIPAGKVLTLSSGASHAGDSGMITVDAAAVVDDVNLVDPDLANNLVKHRIEVLPVPIEPEADLSVSIAATDSAISGDFVPVQIVVANAGPAPAAARILVNQTGPLSGAIWACLTPAALCATGEFDNDAQGMIGLIQIPAGGSVILSSGSSQAIDPGTVVIDTIVAVEGASPTDPSPENDEAHHEIEVLPMPPDPEADLSVTIIAPDRAADGEDVSISVLMSNAGPMSAIAEIVLAHAASLQTSGWSCVAPAVLCSAGEFENGISSMYGVVEIHPGETLELSPVNSHVTYDKINPIISISADITLSGSGLSDPDPDNNHLLHELTIFPEHQGLDDRIFFNDFECGEAVLPGC